jgi:hypothetical protein
MSRHGLLQGHPPPSREGLLEWLRHNDIDISLHVEIRDMEEGEGWMVVSKDLMDVNELST